MKNKVLYSGINLGIGITLLFIGIKRLKPNFIFNQEEQIALGIFFTVMGSIMLVWRIAGFKNENILLVSTIIIGFLLLVAGLILMSKNSLYGISVIAPGVHFIFKKLRYFLKEKVSKSGIFR